jgi:hypothetical protein
MERSAVNVSRGQLRLRESCAKLNEVLWIYAELLIIKRSFPGFSRL